jgi:hypothetical protein
MNFFNIIPVNSPRLILKGGQRMGIRVFTLSFRNLSALHKRIGEKIIVNFFFFEGDYPIRY